MYFLFFFLGSLTFVVGLTLGICRVLSFGLCFNCLGCILFTVFWNLVRKVGGFCVLDENNGVHIISSQNGEGKQLSPPP